MKQKQSLINIRLFVERILIGVILLSTFYGNVAFANSREANTQGRIKKQINVVWILLDGCRAGNFGCYGYKRPTSPTIDTIARIGTVFCEHYTNASKTCNSVPSFMTSKYFARPCFTNRYSLTILSLEIPPDEAMFGDIMRENGYTSAMFTNMPLFQKTDRLSQSFDEVFIWRQGEKVLLQRWAVMQKELDTWLDAKKDTPFFLYIHSADTHFPHEMISPYDQWIDPDYKSDQLLPMGYGQNYMRRDHKPFTNKDKAYLQALYDGMILDADNQIRLLIEKLKQLDIFEDTVIIITADHGQLLGEDGYTVAHVGTSDQVMHIPLIMCGPDIPSGTIVDSLTENVDIVPTLVNLLNLKTTASFDGQNLIPTMYGTDRHRTRTYTFAAPDRLIYEIPKNFIFRGFKEKFEFDSEGRLEQVFKTPDFEPYRIDDIESMRKTGTLMEERLQEQFLPLLRRMQSLPVKSVKMEAAWIANAIQPREYVVDNYMSGAKSTIELEHDNKWAYSDGFLWACNGKETVPELKFQVDMPDGIYNAWVKLYNSQDHNGMPASSFVIHINEEPTLRRVLCVSLPDKYGTTTSVPLGKIRVNGQQIMFNIHPGEPGYWTMIEGIDLYPENSAEKAKTNPTEMPDNSPEEDSEYHELIRGLGYL